MGALWPWGNSKIEKSVHCLFVMSVIVRSTTEYWGIPPPKISRLLLVSSKIFYGYIYSVKYLVSSAKYLADYTLVVDTEIANSPK